MLTVYLVSLFVQMLSPLLDFLFLEGRPERFTSNSTLCYTHFLALTSHILFSNYLLKEQKTQNLCPGLAGERDGVRVST